MNIFCGLVTVTGTSQIDSSRYDRCGNDKLVHIFSWRLIFNTKTDTSNSFQWKVNDEKCLMRHAQHVHPAEFGEIHLLSVFLFSFNSSREYPISSKWHNFSTKITSNKIGCENKIFFLNFNFHDKFPSEIDKSWKYHSKKILSESQKWLFLKLRAK